MSDAGPYSIGSDVWPGISKLIEECGEVLQVAGKIIGMGPAADYTHWDGTHLIEELGDLLAAVDYVRAHNLFGLAPSEAGRRIDARRDAKFALFQTWHGTNRTTTKGPTT